MEYREPLPPECPPDTAQQVDAPTIRYRLLENAEPTEADFDSYVKRKGGSNPTINRAPCHQNGLSVLTTLKAAEDKIKAPYNKKARWTQIGELTIQPGAGTLEPPEANGHQTWWPAKTFNVLAHCRTLL